jgi:hypothetical protein
MYVQSSDTSAQLHNHTSLPIKPNQPCDAGESQLSAVHQCTNIDICALEVFLKKSYWKATHLYHPQHAPAEYDSTQLRSTRSLGQLSYREILVLKLESAGLKKVDIKAHTTSRLYGADRGLLISRLLDLERCPEERPDLVQGQFAAAAVWGLHRRRGRRLRPGRRLRSGGRERREIQRRRRAPRRVRRDPHRCCSAAAQIRKVAEQLKDCRCLPGDERAELRDGRPRNLEIIPLGPQKHMSLPIVIIRRAAVGFG